MKNRILKVLAVIGILAGFFCTAAGSANSTTGQPEDTAIDAARLRASISGGISLSPHLLVKPKSSRRPEWLPAAFAVSIPASLPDGEAGSFSETVSRALQPSYVYSAEEKAYIARVVYAEARGETFEGKVAVAAVVLNRFESGLFGSTVKKVVFGRNQFAVSRKYTAECMGAVEEAIGQPSAWPDDMYYFRVSKSKKWRNFEYFLRIGNHSFYCAE